MRLTALLHHVTEELLAESFHKLKRRAAPGVDGVTWEEYAEGWQARIRDLHRRVHQQTYRVRPSLRKYIPKGNGRKRPLGISALEDKIVQQAVRTVLEVIYEEEFLGFSYGFRPGRSQHNALDALWMGLMTRPIGWVLDADIRGYFDAIDHEWLLKMIRHRIGDRRILRLIEQWLKAGIIEEGRWWEQEEGTPQGAVISPLLANIYLHYVLDLWTEAYRNRPGKGTMMIVRFADDFVVGFQDRRDAEAYRQDLSERLQGFGLELNAEKTRLIEFGRNAARNRRQEGRKRPDTFDFLGLRHICSQDQKGRFRVERRTVGSRLRRSLEKIRDELRVRRHRPIPEQGKYVKAAVQGFFNYHAVPGNSSALNSYRTEVNRAWRHSLKRRSQKNRMPWERFKRYVRRWVPSVQILHPLPAFRWPPPPKVRAV